MNSFLFLVFCIIALGASAKKVRIVNPDFAVPGEFPYMVSLQIDGYHFCGGSLITVRYILSAAHCLYKDYEKKTDMNRIKAVVGTTDTTSGRVMDIDRIILHADYVHSDTNPTFYADVAVLRMRFPVQLSEYVKLIDLPNQGYEVPTGLELRVSGFGSSMIGGPNSRFLKKVTLYAMNQRACESWLAPWKVSDSLFCANYAPGWGTCKGDSGGPVTFNKQVLIGIVSAGDPDNCTTTDPILFTKVSHFLDFIYNEIQVLN